jgi:hypothetical protein
MNEEQSTFRDIANKTFAIIGVVAVLLVGMWLAVNAVTMVPRLASVLASAMVSMSSIFVPGERIEISVPDVIEAEKPFTLSWDHINKSKKGTYAFSFTCANDLYFTTSLTAGGKSIVCDTPFQSTELKGNITLTPHTKSIQDLDTDFVISFVENGSDTTSVESRMAATVVPAAHTATNTTPTGTTSAKPRNPGSSTTRTYTYTGTSIPSNPNGVVDLRAKVLAVGTLDRTTGEFTASSSINVNARVGVKFEIENVGTRTSSAWAFIAQLPTIPFHSFQSAQQIPLAPGDKIEYTIGFDSVEIQNKVQILINVDPSSQTYDVDRSNNLVRHDIFLNVK